MPDISAQQQIYQYMTELCEAEEDASETEDKQIFWYLLYSRELQNRKALCFQHRFYGFLTYHTFAPKAEKREKEEIA